MKEVCFCRSRNLSAADERGADDKVKEPYREGAPHFFTAVRRGSLPLSCLSPLLLLGLPHGLSSSTFFSSPNDPKISDSSVPAGVPYQVLGHRTVVYSLTHGDRNTWKHSLKQTHNNLVDRGKISPLDLSQVL